MAQFDRWKNYRKRINSVRWQRLRRDKLKANVWCEDCLRQGRRTLATEVHHAVAIMTADNAAAQDRLAFDWHNLVSLCHDCHVARHRGVSNRLPTDGSRPVPPRERIRRYHERETTAFAERFFGGEGVADVKVPEAEEDRTDEA